MSRVLPAVPLALRTASIDGVKFFYREAGLADAPVMLLLHGFLTSSHMFRHFIPRSRNVITSSHRTTMALARARRLITSWAGERVSSECRPAIWASRDARRMDRGVHRRPLPSNAGRSFRPGRRSSSIAMVRSARSTSAEGCLAPSTRRTRDAECRFDAAVTRSLRRPAGPCPSGRRDRGSRTDRCSSHGTAPAGVCP